jgi:UDP-glucose 4-epimerase
MQIDGANILVTGGCGLIGSTTIDLMLKHHSPARVLILDNLSRGTVANVEHALRDRRVTLVKGDIRDPEAVRSAVQGIDAVLHMAALRITACAAEPREAMAVMCDGSYNVVEAAKHAGVQKIVAASTASVYGLAETFPTPEEHHPYNNRTWYGASKVMLEGCCALSTRCSGFPMSHCAISMSTGRAWTFMGGTPRY